jgi:septal ring factor EnvC (AmiA/AmiB activator)
MASRSSSLSLTVASLAALALGIALSGQTPTTGRAKTPAERASARIRALEREADALAAQESKLLVELRKLEVERQLKIEELASIEQQKKDTARQLAEGTKKAEELKRTAEADRPDVESRLVQLYMLGRAGYWRLLLDVDDMRSLGRAYRTAAALTRLDRDRIQGYQRTLEALASERATLQARSTQLATLEEQATRARAALDRAVGARSALVASIDARRDLNAQLTSELEAAQQKLQTSVNRLDANGGRHAALPFRPFQGALPWPARGQVIARFGRQPTSRFGTAIVKDGIEIGAAEGQPVRSVHEGTVGFAGQFTGYGNLVIVEHGDRAFSLYGHLGSVQVAQGERVEAQTAVGSSGRNPAGSPAVYFGLRVDGKAVDPLQWLEKGSQ